MSNASPAPAAADLSALAWVAGELQRSLEAAHKALRRFQKEAQSTRDSDVDAADPATLRTARVQLHQSVGALELVDLPIPARVLRSSEAAVQRMIGKPALVTEEAIEAIERASFAVVDYLQRTLAGRPVSGVALFPQYREVQVLAGGDRIHPADLWGQQWRWQTLPDEPGVPPRASDDDARDGMERLVLALMRRTSPESTGRMSDFCAELGAGARSGFAATVWRLAAAFFDAQSAGLLDSDVYAKRMASRLLAQLRTSVQRHDEVSERLAADLLFFCARAQAPEGPVAPRLQSVRQAWGLADSAVGTDYQTPRLGRFDPAQVAMARKRITQAKDAWSVVAGGESRRSTGLVESFTLLSDSLRQLLPEGDVLAQALLTVAHQVQNAGLPPGDALAMEMATAMLWLDAVVEEGELDAPELGERTRLVARRIDLAREGGEIQPLEPWIEQLYRRVSDQQTMGSVVQELRSALTEVEKQIDQYFRDPSQREVLVPVPAQLSAMRGVLSVLDLEQASQAVVHMRNAVDELAATEVDPARAREVGTFDRLADNLGALGFLIDMVSVQPALARSLFRFEPETGRLLAATGAPTRMALPEAPAAPALSDEARSLAEAAVGDGVSDAELARQLEDLTRRAVVDDQAGLARVAADAQHALEGARDDSERAAARAELAQAVTHLVAPVPVPELPVSAPIPPVRETPTVPGGTGLEDDDEMREIFIEEAREVIATAREALQHLAANAEDVGELTVVRRSFHTLKGSSRMVGLRDFGEAAWACEQVYNARLAEDPRLDPNLAAFSDDALSQLAAWVEDLAAKRSAVHDPGPLVRRGEILRGVAPAPTVVPPAFAAPALQVPALPDLPEVVEADAAEAAEPLPLPIAFVDEGTGDPQPEAGPSPQEAQEPLALPELPLEPAPGGDAWTSPTFETAGSDVPERAAEALAADGPVLDALAAGDDGPDARQDLGGLLPMGSAQDAPAGPPRVAEGGPEAASAADAVALDVQVGDDADLPDALTDTTPMPPGAFLAADAVADASTPQVPLDAVDEAASVMDAAAPAAPDMPPPPFEPTGLEFTLDLGETDRPADLSPEPRHEGVAAAGEPPLQTEGMDWPGDDPALPVAEVVDAPLDLAADWAPDPAPGAPVPGDVVDERAAWPALTDRIPDLPAASDLDLAPVAAPEGWPADDMAAPAPADDALRLDDALTPEALDAAGGEPGPAPDLAIDLADGLRLPEGQQAPGRASEPTDPAPVEPMTWAMDLDVLDAAAAPQDAPDLDDVAGLAQVAEPAARIEVPEVLDAPAASLHETAPTDIRPEPEPEPEAIAAEDPVKVVGPLRIPIPLFNIFLNEADEQSRRLVTEVAEWTLEQASRPVPESTVALAHSLAGNSATVGYAELSALARALEHALSRSAQQGRGRDGEAALFGDAAEEIRRLLHQFAAGFLRSVPPALMARLADHEHWASVDVLPDAQPFAGHLPDDPVLQEPARDLPTTLTLDETSDLPAIADEDDLESEDSIDHDLLPIFAEEAAELLPKLQGQLSDWSRHPNGRHAAEACLRTLHTFKGGARLAGAMRVGELAHRLETDIEGLLGHEAPTPDALDALQHRLDRMAALFDATCLAAQRGGPSEAPVPAPPAAPSITPSPSATTPGFPAHALGLLPLAAPASVPVASVDEAESPGAPAEDVEAAPALPPTPGDREDVQGDVEHAAESGVTAWAEPAPAELSETAEAPAQPAPVVSIDWARFADVGALTAAAPTALAAPGSAQAGVVRVRTGLLDRLVNGAGEVSIARSRIESDVRTLQGSLEELTGSLERMRRELRDIEVQAETQIASRIEAAKASAQAFDPLEMDRFTRLQELTRMMAESVNDVATLQRSLQRTLQSTEDQLAAQSRLTRELQDDLLRTRMVEFESLADRLYRVVRQAAKDLGKQVRLEITGGSIEVDRGVLERMVGPFEHMLRNSVVHGIEAPPERTAAGKDPTGTIRIVVSQVGNEVGVEFGDDGRGLDLLRIRERAVDRGLLPADAQPGDEELAQMIFVPGFTTAGTVSELAGRGIGMDVVRSEVNAMGGRIETQSAPQQGVRFRLVLPLTTAVTQVVLLSAGPATVAVPSSLVEVVRRVSVAELSKAYDEGTVPLGDAPVPFYWLPELLDGSGRGPLEGRTQLVVFVQSASQRVALHVQEVLGNQEVVVKNVGPQLSHMPGLAGVTLLPSGAAALIYNPVALAALYGDDIAERRRQGGELRDAPAALVPAVSSDVASVAPLVMVVDDSLTVRRVTQRLLEREGYRVVLAKDGMDALEKLAEVRPIVMLCDIEMPRMDGFELVRVLRSDPERADIPVVMITSRIAQKHRDHAAQLGVQHYLGKPYPEDRLLALVAEYAAAEAAA